MSRSRSSSALGGKCSRFAHDLFPPFRAQSSFAHDLDIDLEERFELLFETDDIEERNARSEGDKKI